MADREEWQVSCMGEREQRLLAQCSPSIGRAEGPSKCRQAAEQQRLQPLPPLHTHQRDARHNPRSEQPDEVPPVPLHAAVRRPGIEIVHLLSGGHERRKELESRRCAAAEEASQCRCALCPA